MKKLILAAGILSMVIFVNAFAGDKETSTPAAPAAAPATSAVPAAPATPPAPTPAPVVDPAKVVVTVNGEKVTEKEIADELQKRIEGQAKRMPAGMTMPDSYRQQMRKRVVDMKVEQILMNQEAKKKNINISEPNVIAEITKIAGQRNQSMEDVEKEIANYGMSMDDLKGQIRYQMQIKALMKAEGKASDATNEEVKKFYDENPQHFDKPEQVRASHILIKFEPNATAEDKAKAKEKIEGILKRAKAGEDFATLAKEFTEDPGSKETGGEYTFPRGQMVKPFEDAAFSMEPGQISDVIETQFGYHIIKLSEKIPAGKTSFDEVKAQITEYLSSQKQNEYWNEYNKKIHDDAKIEYSPEEQALRAEMEKEAAARMAPKTEPAGQPQKIKPQSEAKPEANPEAKPEAKPEIKTEQKTE